MNDILKKYCGDVEKLTKEELLEYSRIILNRFLLHENTSEDWKYTYKANINYLNDPATEFIFDVTDSSDWKEEYLRNIIRIKHSEQEGFGFSFTYIILLIERFDIDILNYLKLTQTMIDLLLKNKNITDDLRLWLEMQ